MEQLQSGRDERRMRQVSNRPLKMIKEIMDKEKHDD